MKKWLDESISQDVERIRSNDRHTKTSDKHDKDSGRSKHHNYGDGGHNSEG